MNTYPWNDLDMKAYNSFIYNSPKLEAIQQSINRGMTKSTVSYSHKGIRFSNHKEQILIHTTTWMHLTDAGLRTKARDERVPAAWSHSHGVQEEAKLTYAGKIQNTVVSRERGIDWACRWGNSLEWMARFDTTDVNYMSVPFCQNCTFNIHVFQCM